MNGNGDASVDLSDKLELTAALLSDPHAWRHRVVEEVTITTTLHYQVWRSYQVLLPDEIVRPFLFGAPGVERVRVLLPVATLPKRQLLAFHLLGPDGSPHCLETRKSTAGVEAYYLLRLAEQIGVSDTVLKGLPEELLEAICLFMPGTYQEKVSSKGDTAVANYLEEGLEFALSSDDLATARKYARLAGGLLATALGEDRDPLSSAENILLALPLVEPRPGNRDETLTLVHDYWWSVTLIEEEARARAAAAMEQARRTKDEEEAKRLAAEEEAKVRGLLSAIARYGRRFDAMTEAELPIAAPALLKISDERPLLENGRPQPGHPRGVDVRDKGPFSRLWARLSHIAGAQWFGHRAIMDEASSYHLQLRVADPAAELDAFKIYDPDAEQPLGIPVFEGVRETDELLALYTSHRERPRQAVIWAYVRATPDVLVTSLVVVGPAWTVAIYSLFGLADPDHFAVLAVPTTFAIALLQIREQTPLGSSLQRGAKLAMLAGLVALWIVVLGRLWFADPPATNNPSPAVTTSSRGVR
jgi:hypothetical protein